MDADVKELLEASRASEEGFNNKDIQAWVGPFVDNAVSYNPNFAALGLPLLPNGFMGAEVFKSLAEQMIHGYKSFTTRNLDARIVDDTGVVFGEYVLEMADGTKETGAATWTCARVNGDWKVLCSHYTPAP